VEPTDEALCQRVAERDDVAFELLVSRYQQRAYRLAWSILRDAEEARDVAQEVFVRLYQRAGSFGGRARFSTWFYRLVVNLSLDHQRRGRWWRRFVRGGGSNGEDDDRPDVLERLPAPGSDPIESVDRDRRMKQLWAAVDRLAPRQRAAVLLHVQEGLSTREVAATLECSEATVRVHLHRALTALKKTMEKD
jgi:RNA polymerase sigma-70 factor (ECF subfamily)